MSSDVVRILPRKFAIIIEDQLESMRHDADELDHLQGGHVLLPPDVFLILRTQSSHEIIEVHEHVYEDVEESEEGGVATGNESHAWPH